MAFSVPDGFGCWLVGTALPEDFRSVSAPRPGIRKEFLPTGTVDDAGVVQHAASGLSLCHRADHAAEKRADDGRSGQGYAILMLTGWPRTTLGTSGDG